MTVELVDSGMFTLVQYNLDSIALIAFSDLSQEHYSSRTNISFAISKETIVVFKNRSTFFCSLEVVPF